MASFDTLRESRTGEVDDEPEKIPPILPCAECKTMVRTAYFNLDGRPLCPRCSQPYREKIDRGTGSAAMGRAILYGSGAAVVGMIGVALLLLVVNGFRIIASLGVAWLVATAIGKATANYGGRRYQILAVSLTYVALGLSMLMPVIVAANQLSKVKAPPKSESRAGPAGERAQFQDEINSLASQPRENEDEATVAARADSIAQADSVRRLEQTRANLKAHDGNMQVADRLDGGFASKVLGAFWLILLLPIIGSFLSYGPYAAAMSILALGFAMRRAWQMTDLVTDYDLTGPFRVGEGPIAPKFGGS
ncbi:MAG: hypothetical protein ABIT20_00555 [Gemmatimonadaceae bacterium]